MKIIYYRRNNMATGKSRAANREVPTGLVRHKIPGDGNYMLARGRTASDADAPGSRERPCSRHKERQYHFMCRPGRVALSGWRARRLRYNQRIVKKRLRFWHSLFSGYKDYGLRFFSLFCNRHGPELPVLCRFFSRRARCGLRP